MVLLNSYSIYHPLRTTDLLNSMHMIRNTSHKTSDEDMYLNMDYEMHMGTKLDYHFFQSSRLLQASEIQLFKNQCEQERTQTLTILMLSLENPRLAGYMLTGNRQCSWKLMAA